MKSYSEMLAMKPLLLLHGNNALGIIIECIRSTSAKKAVRFSWEYNHPRELFWDKITKVSDSVKYILTLHREKENDIVWGNMYT